MYSIKDKVVVITGASSGIGHALAIAAIGRGAKAAVCGRDINKLKDAFPGVDPARIRFFQADVSIEKDCAAFTNFVIQTWGQIDILINNAGISMRALFEDADLSVIKELMDINFWGTVYMTKYALPTIRKQNGVVLGVSSVAGYRGLPGRTGYSASKFAMQGFLEALRTELLHTGTHVMWVSPGFTASNIRAVARSSNGSAQGETPLEESKLMSAEECAKRILDAIQQRKRSVIFTFMGNVTVWLNKLFSSTADKLVYNHFLKEPNSPLVKYETNQKGK
ncbi:MAG: SDR family oxidoreductase [Flavipsychrobacter sp.]|nr:SDR family oxidoreductase [Flavipsychrobacter sp.]